MTSERDERTRRVLEILEAALVVDPPNRARFVAATCQGDSSLRAEVESLLELEREAAGFLQPVSDGFEPTAVSLGAFLAGLLFAETEYRHQIEVDIEPFRGLLLGLFFVSIGMGIDIAQVAAMEPSAADRAYRLLGNGT